MHEEVKCERIVMTKSEREALIEELITLMEKLRDAIKESSVSEPENRGQGCF